MNNANATVYCDKDKLDEAEKRGFKRRQLLETAIDAALQNELDDIVVTLKLGRLEEEISLLEQTQLILERQAVEVGERLTYLRQARDQLKVDWEKTKMISKRSGLIRQLNQIAIATDYDANIVAENAKPIINELLKTDPAFDIEKHISRFKKIMRG